MTSLMKNAPSSPARELTTMRNRLRRFFEEPFAMDFALPMNLERRFETLIWSPAVEAIENEKEYVITAELPGISPESIEVNVVEGVLTLKGTKEEERKSEEQDRSVHLWEREYGRFERVFRFPLEVEDTKVAAEFTNGVLTIRVPKAKVARPEARTVPIAKK